MTSADFPLVAALFLALVALCLYIALHPCKFGIHRWHYIPNDHGGKPMRRVCLYCNKRQAWNYDLAREHGVIQWDNCNGK